MAELMGQRGAGKGQTPVEQEEREAQERDAEDQRQAMLASIMQPEAKQRLARIALVKPDKARGIENMLLMQAQTGRLTEKISEGQLIQLLEQVNQSTKDKTKVTIQRRKNVLDDDDDADF
ncbi:unnamed protein product [Ostreobium quekettii]|uniref:Programmed cell death protein 5 n=1 Tax=Ostreobium quekettii TaxID=121088 RepID=A0A8S1ITL2_9CHLO|nr:unnamed protein product [Ostreobium quekettii]